MKHILESKQFDRTFLDELFASADALNGVRDESLKGKILTTLFYEPSTRTRLSFESAFTRLGGSVLSVENARGSSSAVKGETIEDTARVISQYADVLVMRSNEDGAAKRAANAASIPVINAGDGSGEHPTQSLLDVYTIYKELGNVDGIHVAFVGDLKYGRAARSLAYILTLFDNVTMTFVSTKDLQMRDDVKEYLIDKGVQFSETTDLEAGIKEADVVYMTRIQQERFETEEEYEKHKGDFVLTRALVDGMKEKAIVMHPLPRIDEIQTDVDSSSKAVYFKQAGYGVLVRMALLKHILS